MKFLFIMMTPKLPQPIKNVPHQHWFNSFLSVSIRSLMLPLHCVGKTEEK